MKKRTVALILSLMMASSALAGCGAEPAGTSESTVGEESQVIASETETTETGTETEEIAVDHFAGTTIKIVVKKKANDNCNDWNEKEIFKLAEEATGIHVEWTLVDASASEDKIAVMLMGDDQPDAYLGAITESTLSNNLDLFYDLSEEGLLEKWAPKVVEDYNTVDSAWSSITWNDGSIRGLLTGNMAVGLTSYAASPLIINQEWLDKIGKEVPTTADDLYEVLVAFRDNDMDGDGDKNNEIPLSFCNGNWEGDLMMHANAFGIAGNATWQAKDHYKNIEDGKVTSTVDTDNYRAFLEFYHKLYEENLLDVEGFSQTSDQYSAKRTEKVVGVLGSYKVLMDQGYTPFVYQGMEGVEPKLTGLVERFAAQRSNFCITAGSENVEAVLHWWNWLSGNTETKNIAYGGSGYFEIDADGSVYKKLGLTDAATMAATEGMHNYGPAFLPGEAPVDRPEAIAADESVRQAFIKENLALLNQEGFPTTYSDAASEEERAFIETELFAYIENFTATAIVEGVTDASWTQHLEDLKTVQYYDWLDWYQDFVDAAAAKVN